MPFRYLYTIPLCLFKKVSIMGSELEISNSNTTSGLSGSHYCWTRHSDTALYNVEKKILSCVKTLYKRYYVDIGPVVGKKGEKIWTLSMNEESDRTPLVMLHGMGAGLALWCPNLDALAASRPVYAIDLLGFGRSSRPKFASEALKAEAQWVESVEEWRRELNLERFVLLGHSLGGYIATAYTIKYPERVKHLIVADPWGYNEGSIEAEERFQQLPIWKRAVVSSMLLFNPLWAVRAAGPAGKWLVTRSRPDIPKKYVKYVPDAETIIPEYIYQCNSQTPSGETAFQTLGEKFLYAKHPMLNRLEEIHPSVSMTYLYGSKTWLPPCHDQLPQRRTSGKVYVKVIDEASHHIYLDSPDVFNSAVLESCSIADEDNSKIKPLKIVETNGNTVPSVARVEDQSKKIDNAISDQSETVVLTSTNQNGNVIAVAQ